jgi:hypothetical protein
MTETKLQLFMRRSGKGTAVTIDLTTVVFGVRGTGCPSAEVLRRRRIQTLAGPEY